jgi:hypothetical protein
MRKGDVKLPVLLGTEGEQFGLSAESYSSMI